VVHPDPDPTSSTLCPGRTSSSRSIASTVLGCEFVCPRPIGSGPSYPALRCCDAGRNRSRDIAANASPTRSAPVIPPR